MSATTSVKVVACAPPGLISSSAATAAFTLQLAPAFLSTQQTSVPTTQAGWDYMTTGAPGTAIQIPAAAAQPYGPLAVWQVLATPCSAGDTATKAGTCTGAPAYTLPDFYCWSKNATAICAGTTAQCAANGGGTVGNGVPIGSASAGDTVSVIGCRFSGAAVVYASSAATTVAFSN
jgi:hypothetical protein